MSKILNNPIMKGASGMLGDVVVYRELRGKLVMANRPKRRQGVLTPAQELAKSRFLSAVRYANGQMADPVSKEYYQLLKANFPSAYAAAVADYLKAPVVKLIDTAKYGGAVADEILIKAVDNFKLTSVLVSIFGANGSLIEQGEPALLPNSIEDFVYKATVANQALAGTKILVTLRDRPGNITVQEKLL
jgi:hypothetical protein